MRSRGLWIAVALVLVLVTPVSALGGSAGHHARARAPRPPARAQSTGTRIETWSPGAWSWFEDPRAVRVVGQYDEIFVGWIGWNGAITIGSYDPRFGIRRSRIIGYLAADDHGSPVIFVEPDKRLTVFVSGHNGGAMYYRSTLRPEDITAWGPVRWVPSRLQGPLGFTYPNPVLLPHEHNKLYLFWRGADWSQDYATRTTGGDWSAARRLIAAPGQRPYVKVDSDGRDTIALAFTDGHPRERITSVYYAAYRAGSLWTAGGRRIAPLPSAPIAPQQADLVYDGQAAGVSAWVWDVALDSHHRPVILYATFPTVSDHAYWYADWTGQRWISHFMAFAGPTISPGTIEQQYSGGMALDHSDPGIVYLSRKVRGVFEIERWRTRNGGYSWSHATVVRDGTDNVRPIVPRGWTGGPMGLLWMHGYYGTYTTYRTWIDYLR